MFRRYWFVLSLASLLLVGLPGFLVFVADLLGYEGEIDSWLEGRLGLSHRFSIGSIPGIVLFLLPLVLILLYFLKLRRKPLTVSSTFLWKKSIEDLHVNRFLQWMRHNTLLLLQLASLLGLIYAIVGPRLHGSSASGRHYIITVDNSASMNATDVSPTRLEWAKAQALREIDAATDSDFGMVIVFNSTAEIRQSRTSNRALLRRAVADVRPTSHSTRIEEALILAESLANPARSTENEAVRPLDAEPGKERTYAAPEGIPTTVHVFSDGRFSDVADFALNNLTIHLHIPELPRDTVNNIGIVRMDAVRDDADASKVEVSVRVLNFRAEVASVELKLDVLSRSGNLLDARQKSVYLPKRVVEYPEGESTIPTKDIPGEQIATFTLTGVDTAADVELRATLAGLQDAFPLDDRVSVILGIVRKARVLHVGPKNAAIAYFLDSPSTKDIADVRYITREQLADRKLYGDPARSGEIDLVIFHRCAPEREEDLPLANCLFVGAVPPPWKKTGTAGDPEIVEAVKFPRVQGWVDTHPIMRGLRGWQDLELAEAWRYEALPPRTPRLLEGDRGMPLIFTRSRGTNTDLILAFGLETEDGQWNTRWFMKIGFPLFLRNALYVLGNIRDAGAEDNLRPGQIQILRPPGGVAEIVVRSPSGEKTTIERGGRADFTFSGTDELGVYRVAAKDDERRFAVNLFDPEESHIEPRMSIRIGQEEVRAGVNRSQPLELWRYIVLLGLVLVVVEWYLYNLRVHV